VDTGMPAEVRTDRTVPKQRNSEAFLWGVASMSRRASGIENPGLTKRNENADAGSASSCVNELINLI